MWRWLCLPLALATLCATAQETHRHTDVEQRARNSEAQYALFTKDMHAAMAKMMSDMHAPGFVGNPDMDFLAMMIAHHEGAVEMARLALIYGRDPATRRLADEILASQSVEIQSMKRRLTVLRSGQAPEKDAFPELGGIRGPAR